MNIAIVGCGPAGLCCALQLSKQNHQITIFERMNDLTMQGSGVIIQPIGLAALDLLGVRAGIEQYGQPIHTVIGRSGEHNRLSVYVDYSRLSGINYALGLQRGALFNVLYRKVIESGVQIITNVTIESLQYQQDNRVRVQDENKKVHGEFDFVIDASGAYSKLRQFAVQNIIGKPLHYGSLWSKVDLDDEVNFDRQKMELYSDNNNVGIGLMPIGKLALEDKPQIALFWNMKWQHYPQWRAGNLEEWKNNCIKKWPSTIPFLQQITHHDQLYLAKFIYHRLPKPYGNNLAFVGDAAHATNPQLGQGINMSLVDAVVLAWALQQRSNLTSALALYANTRKNHVVFYQTMARILTPFYQSDNAAAIYCRDKLYGPLCRIPLVRTLTAQLISGRMHKPLKRLA